MRFGVLCLAACLCAASVSKATLGADLAADFSSTDNPDATADGTWSYNSGPAPLSQISSWAGIPGVNGWGPAANTGGDFLPFIFQNTGSNTTAISGSGLDLPVGDVAIHSQDDSNGYGNGQANVTWTSPSDQTANITGTLWPLRDAGRENHYALILDPTGLDLTVASGDIPEGGSVTSADVPIVTGEVVELLLTSDNPSLGDFAGVNLAITQTPEPTALALLIPTLSLAARRRRTKI
jgi:hypothetical protein